MSLIRRQRMLGTPWHGGLEPGRLRQLAGV